MAEWRDSVHHGASAADKAPAGTGDAAGTSVAANNTRDAGAPGPGGEATPTEHAVLTQRIASLEQSLAQIQQELKRPLPVQTPVAATSAAASAIAGSLA